MKASQSIKASQRIAETFDRREFAARLKRARIDAGFGSWHAAGEALGISGHTLKAYEEGRALPNAEKLHRIAAGYKVGLDALLAMGNGGSNGAAFRAGEVLCDEELVRRILSTHDEEELEELLNHTPACVLCLVEIPTGATVLSVKEALQLKEELINHLQTHASGPMRRWFQRHGAEGNSRRGE